MDISTIPFRITAVVHQTDSLLTDVGGDDVRLMLRSILYRRGSNRNDS